MLNAGLQKNHVYYVIRVHVRCNETLITRDNINCFLILERPVYIISDRYVNMNVIHSFYGSIALLEMTDFCLKITLLLKARVADKLSRQIRYSKCIY